MKKIKATSAIFYASIVLSTVLIYGCKKDRIEPKSLKEYASPNEYLDSKKQEEQEFIIDNDTSSGPIIGNQGTKIYPTGSSCLMHANGDTIALPFSIKLVELYTPKDMIYWQIPTVASGSPLATEGEVRVRACKDGTELVLGSGCNYQVKMPSAAPQNNMDVYYGFDDPPTTNWTNDLSSLGVTPVSSGTFTVEGNFHVANIDKSGWVNCASGVVGIDFHQLTFSSTTDDLTNVALFIYMPATKTVMQVFNSVSGYIPEGTEVEIIAIGVDGSGKLFNYNKTLTVNADETLDITLAEISDANLTSLLDNL